VLPADTNTGETRYLLNADVVRTRVMVADFWHLLQGRFILSLMFDPITAISAINRERTNYIDKLVYRSLLLLRKNNEDSE